MFNYLIYLPITMIVGAAVALSGCSNQGTAHYSAQIRRTEQGIPHIKALDVGSLGYGFGYVQAQDDLCTLADGFLTWRGERSRYYGPTLRPTTASMYGATISMQETNEDFDFFFKDVVDDAAVKKNQAAQSATIRDVAKGFVDGYNRYLGEFKAGKFPGKHAACKGKPWLLPITADDIARRVITATLAGGYTRLAYAIARSQPNQHEDDPAPGTHSVGTDRVRKALQGLKGLGGITGSSGLGSNALAFGTANTDMGSSILFGNPHWFWDGPDRFYEAQLTIPGHLNIAGVTFLGLPIIQIGFNDRIAWTHTVASGSWRFGFFTLTVPAADTHGKIDETSYMFDGQKVAMTHKDITVQELQDDGTLASVSRTLYWTRFGPALDMVLMNQKKLKIAGAEVHWNKYHAFAMHDANADNTAVMQNFLDWSQATSLDDFIAIQKKYHAIPWANTIAIGRHNPRVWFTDLGAVPNVSGWYRDSSFYGAGDYRSANAVAGSLLARCSWDQTAPADGGIVGETGFETSSESFVGLPWLEGSDSACDWTKDKDPAVEWLPVKDFPQLLSADYVGNFNDSYWLTNLDKRLINLDGSASVNDPSTHYPRVLGQTGKIEDLRPRLGHQITKQLRGDKYGHHRVSRDALEAKVLDGQSESVRLFKDIITDTDPESANNYQRLPWGRWAHVPPICSDDTTDPINTHVQIACTQLKAWDGLGTRTSVGANLWSIFWKKFSPDGELNRDVRGSMETSFRPVHPISTPNGLSFIGRWASPSIRNTMRSALNVAVSSEVLKDKDGHSEGTGLGEYVNATRGDLLYRRAADGNKIGLFGGCDSEGYFTAVCPTHGLNEPILDAGGYIVGTYPDFSMDNYPLANHRRIAPGPGPYGDSYIQVVSFPNGGDVVADTMLAPSESDDKGSVHYSDATRDFANKTWTRFPFSEADIAQHTQSEVILQQ